MKKKKTPGAAVPQAVDTTVMPAAPSAAAALPLKDSAMGKGEWVELILFFAFALIGVFITVGRVTNIAMLLFLAFTIRKSSVAILREHMCLPVVGLIGMTLIYGAAAIYSPFGETAVLELFRGLCAFSIAGFVLMRFQKKHVPTLLWGCVILIAIVAFVSIDAAASQIIYNPVAYIGELCEADLTSFNLVADGRLSGIFNNSNVLASMTALALLIGLYQMQTVESRKGRFAAAFFMGINAMCFFLCLSRGAILCFGLALLAYLFLTKKEQRGRLFMLMVFSAVVTIVFSVPAFPLLGEGSFVLDLLTLICGPVIFILDEIFSVRISAFFGNHGKALKVTVGAVAVLAVGFVIAAVNITGPYVMNGDEELSRAVSLRAGTYTYDADMTEDVDVLIRVVRKDKLLMGTWEDVYDSTTGDSSFEIPEDAKKIQVRFTGKEGDEINSFTFSDGTKLKLDYPLLPANIARRLQDNLFTSSSFLERIQFMVDALKIWLTSPVFGRGLSSTDNLYTAVQPFFYQSKFVHNHILQYLADTGLVGTAFFLMIAVGLAWLLIRKWKESKEPLSAVFLACMVMMHVHSLMEINFSIRAYGVTAYLLMAVMMVAYGEPLLLKGQIAVKRAVAIAAVSFWAIVTVIVGICISYRVVLFKSNDYQTTDYEEFMQTLDRFITFDALDDDYYKILYLAQGNGASKYSNQVTKYAMELRNSGAFTNCDAVARYYYLPKGQLDEVFICSREGIAQKAADPESWNTEVDFYRAKVLTTMAGDWEHAKEPFIQGIIDFANYLAEYNDGRMEQIELTEDNQAFVDTAIEIWKDPSISIEESYEMLNKYSFAESEA